MTEAEVQQLQNNVGLDLEKREGSTVDTGEQIDFQFIRDETYFRGLADRWRDLAEAAGSPVYVTYEWLSRWWEHFGRHPKRELFVVVFYCGSRVVGIAPFYMGISSLGPVTMQKRLHLMGNGVADFELLGFTDDYGYSDFLDVIVHPGYRDAVARELVNLLLSNPMDVDVIRFPHTREDSFIKSELPPRLEKRDVAYRLEETSEYPFIEVPGTMDEYKEQLASSSRRRRFRKNRNPAGREYAVEQPACREEMEEALESLYRLHQNRWNSLGYPGTFFDRRHYRFFKDMCGVAYEQGWLWMTLARDEEGICAVRLALRFGGRFYDWISGFDKSSPVSKFSPGLGLLSLMIDDAIYTDATRIELLRGAERYKFDFTKKSGSNWALTIPLCSERSFARKIMNRSLEGLAKIWSLVNQEWTLLRVQYQEKGPVWMWYGYVAFRAECLSDKMRIGEHFSTSDN